MSDDQYADALVMPKSWHRMCSRCRPKRRRVNWPLRLEPAVRLRDIVHHATEMIGAQLGVSVDQAQVRLKAHAFVNDRSFNEFAGDMVTRRFRFESTN
jgi:hypothetical protein